MLVGFLTITIVIVVNENQYQAKLSMPATQFLEHSIIHIQNEWLSSYGIHSIDSHNTPSLVNP